MTYMYHGIGIMLYNDRLQFATEQNDVYVKYYIVCINKICCISLVIFDVIIIIFTSMR